MPHIGLPKVLIIIFATNNLFTVKEIELRKKRCDGEANKKPRDLWWYERVKVNFGLYSKKEIH